LGARRAVVARPTSPAAPSAAAAPSNPRRLIHPWRLIGHPLSPGAGHPPCGLRPPCGSTAAVWAQYSPVHGPRQPVRGARVKSLWEFTMIVLGMEWFHVARHFAPC